MKSPQSGLDRVAPEGPCGGRALCDELGPGPLDRCQTDKSGGHVGSDIKGQEHASKNGVFHRQTLWTN